MPTNAEIVVGRIGRAHGLRGEVMVEVRTDFPEVRFAQGSLLVLDDGRHLEVRTSRPQGKGLAVSFVGVIDRTEAEQLRGRLLHAESHVMPEILEPDTYHDQDLVGLTVVGPNCREFGTVTEVVHLPGQDLLAVLMLNGDEVLVPFVAQIVPQVDLVGRRVHIDPPAGLFEPSNRGPR
jgi:16S rRNA processing protein RimM